MHAVKPLHLKAILLIIGAALWLMLSACGKGPEADALRVRLELPAGQDPEVFWFGLDRKELTLTGENGTRRLDWRPGSYAEVDARAGEEITFSAYDAGGEARVRGEARVGQEKSVTIPVRQLYN
jgi:hypothetical protein